jgi:5-methylcytosine-specific restriction endonuclease McrA
MEIKSVKRPWQKAQRQSSDNSKYYQTSDWRARVDYIWIRDKGLCQLCWEKGVIHKLERGTKDLSKQGTVDHKEQRKVSGRDDYDNLWLIGSNHHNVKSVIEGNQMRKA